MKKIILITLLLGATKLFAQLAQDSVYANDFKLTISKISFLQQQDSITNKLLQRIEKNVSQQQQAIDALNKKLNNQNYTIRKQSNSIAALQNENKGLNNSIDSLSLLIQINGKNIVTNSKELGTKIQETGQKADSQIAQLDSDVEKNRLYWIIATLVTLLLGGLIYWLLAKRITSSKTDVETQIKNTKASLEEESVKLDNKLIEVLESQLKLKQEAAIAEPANIKEKEDHSLALKVADEIVRMQKNISKMGSNTKGLKPLLKGIERIQNNFAANGYEMINHLNNVYDERFNIDVINFITDENLDEGTRIITAVIKPQVNYKGVLIQRAQVDVSQN